MCDHDSPVPAVIHHIRIGWVMSNDRILVAEAMGWTHIRNKYIAMEEKSYPFGCPPASEYSDGKVDKRIKEQIPDPEHDANDDYACLEWARNQGDEFYSAFCRVVRWTWLHRGGDKVQVLFAVFCEYKTGDYFRAAVTVLKDQS